MRKNLGLGRLSAGRRREGVAECGHRMSNQDPARSMNDWPHENRCREILRREGRGEDAGLRGWSAWIRKGGLVGLVLALLCFAGCARRESQERIRGLTDDDCRLLVKKVKPLCASAPRKGEDDDSRTWLRGEAIPSTLSYLKPRRVYIAQDSVIIELWRGGGGDDSIYVMEDSEGVWQVSVHEGDFLNKDRTIWISDRGMVR